MCACGPIICERWFLRSATPKWARRRACILPRRKSTFLEELQSISMTSDFFAGIMTAWQLDGVKFAFAQSIVTTRKNIEGFGGYETLENRPADDLFIGRRAVEQGLEAKLLPYVVQSVADFRTMHDLLLKRIRWMTVMRYMRPWGHFGLLFTFGLPWALVAIAAHPTAMIAAVYLGVYFAFRIAMTWLIGVWGMKQTGIWKRIPLIPTVGRDGLRHLADQFRTENHPLAWR